MKTREKRRLLRRPHIETLFILVFARTRHRACGMSASPTCPRGLVPPPRRARSPRRPPARARAMSSESPGASPARPAFSSLPVLTLPPPGCSRAAEAAFAAELREVCHTVGFFYVAGIDAFVSPTTRRDALAAATRFFAMPQEKKDAMDYRNSPAFRGYVRLGAENTAGLPDLREQVEFGVEMTDDDAFVTANNADLLRAQGFFVDVHCPVHPVYGRPLSACERIPDQINFNRQRTYERVLGGDAQGPVAKHVEDAVLFYMSVPDCVLLNGEWELFARSLEDGSMTAAYPMMIVDLDRFVLTMQSPPTLLIDRRSIPSNLHARVIACENVNEARKMCPGLRAKFMVPRSRAEYMPVPEEVAVAYLQVGLFAWRQAKARDHDRVNLAAHLTSAITYYATLHQRVCGATTRGRTLTHFTFDAFKLLFFGIGELWRSGGARPRLPAPARHDVTRDLSEAATAFPPLFSANGTGIRRVAFEAFLPAREYHHPAPWAVPVTWPRGSASQAASHTGMPCGASAPGPVPMARTASSPSTPSSPSSPSSRHFLSCQSRCRSRCRS